MTTKRTRAVVDRELENARARVKALEHETIQIDNRRKDAKIAKENKNRLNEIATLAAMGPAGIAVLAAREGMNKLDLSPSQTDYISRTLLVVIAAMLTALTLHHTVFSPSDGMPVAEPAAQVAEPRPPTFPDVPVVQPDSPSDALPEIFRGYTPAEAPEGAKTADLGDPDEACEGCHFQIPDPQPAPEEEAPQPSVTVDPETGLERAVVNLPERHREDYAATGELPASVAERNQLAGEVSALGVMLRSGSDSAYLDQIAAKVDGDHVAAFELGHVRDAANFASNIVPDVVSALQDGDAARFRESITRFNEAVGRYSAALEAFNDTQSKGGS